MSSNSANDSVDLAYAFTLEPKDAIAYFRQKGYTIGWNWQDVAQELHAKSFTVAKAARLDVLESIRKELDKAISQGVTQAEFTRQLTPTLQKLGWWGKQVVVDSQGVAQSVQLGSPWRLRTIYQANVQSAYMAGRYKQQMENSDKRPYWMYVAIQDDNTRPDHALLNGRVFRADDPIWETLYPPNGWGCRCRVRTLSQKRLEQLGLTVQQSGNRLSMTRVDAGYDPRTGELYQMDVARYRIGNQSMSPDPGWSQNVGRLAYGSDMALMQKLTAIDNIDLRTQAVQSINNSSLRHQAFANWVDTTLERKRPGHGVQSLGFMDEQVAAAVYQKTGKAPARVLVMRERELGHANSRKHEIDGIALSRGELKQLPAMLTSYNAVFWDNKHDNIMYVKHQGDGAMIMLPVNPDYRLKKQKSRLDALWNAYKIEDRRVLTDKTRFERLR